MKATKRFEGRFRREHRFRAAVFLPLLIYVLVLPPRALPADCNRPPSGSYGSAWAREYQSWCVSCGGTFSMSGGNPSCSPGSNWGGRGQSSPGAGAGSGMYNGFYGLGYQIGQGIGKAIFGDPQEEARKRAQAEMEARRALELNRTMMRQLDEATREQVRQEDERLLNLSLQSRSLAERQRQETLSALKGLPGGDGDLQIKPSTGFFGTPGNPQGGALPLEDPSVVDLRRLDPSKPVTVDNLVLRDLRQDTTKEKVKLSAAECESRKATRDRLSEGLPVQDDAIRRTEAQLEEAVRGVKEASAERRQVLLDAAVNEAKGYATQVLTSAAFLRSQVDLLKGLDVDQGKRDLLIHSLNTMVFEGEGLAKAAQAGYRNSEEMRSKADNLSKEILPQTYKLLVDSGILEKAGEELSGKLGGPLGALAFRGAKLSIDFTVAIGKGRISESEREAARKNLETMRNQRERARKRISELDRDLADGCADVSLRRPL